MTNKKHQINIKDGNNNDKREENNLSEKEEESISEQPEKKVNYEKEVSRLKDTLLRKAAEFDNYKKRTDAEISNFIKYASETIIKELIPVYDDLGRSIESIKKGETKDFETLKKGVMLIYEKFRNVLEKEGLEEINSLGKEFDVDVNSAMMQIPKEE